MKPNTTKKGNGKETAEAKKVSLKFRVEQTGKNPFMLQHATEAKITEVTVIGLARKTGYALANSLHEYATKAMSAKIETGKYITAFRPKAVFKVEVSVNGVVAFHALASKGLDAIRLVNGKGEIISRKLLVDKFELIATAVQSAQTFADMLKFEIKAETKAKAESETVTA